MRPIALVLAVAVQGAGFAPFDVPSMAVAPPLTIAEVTRRGLHGEPGRLAWAPDGEQLYLQSRDGVGAAADIRHFALVLRTGALSTLDAEPAWAASYWHNKVTEAAPGLPWLTIDVRVDRQRTRVAPFTGGFASAGGATGSEAATTVTLASVTLSYVGVEIGHWITDEAKSGVTFGWGPAGSGAMAFVDAQGRLNLLDKESRIRPVPGTSGVLLPAWSDDGNYVAYLEKRGRSKYAVQSVALVRSGMPLR